MVIINIVVVVSNIKSVGNVIFIETIVIIVIEIIN